jgi:hypothetical protein
LRRDIVFPLRRNLVAVKVVSWAESWSCVSKQELTWVKRMLSCLKSDRPSCWKSWEWDQVYRSWENRLKVLTEWATGSLKGRQRLVVEGSFFADLCVPFESELPCWSCQEF